ncbi:hypothetical protein F5Y04DRAFT_255934 [Hypomontagnella monticulosa]|nr:hypothetical protein F5Y04DRAFT_255934 [Hypomontagnella monticulosa]
MVITFHSIITWFFLGSASRLCCYPLPKPRFLGVVRILLLTCAWVDEPLTGPCVRTKGDVRIRLHNENLSLLYT